MKGTQPNGHNYESPYLLSGLIRCDRCGFNFQGQSYRASNTFYYVDGGNMNKGKSVCERTAIRKERLEKFVIDQILENVPFSSAAQRFEEIIASYIENRDTRGQTDQLKVGLAEVKKKIDHLLRAIENGVDQDTVLPNVKHLEREKAAIERALLESQREVLDAKSQKVLACSSAEFFLNFEKNFEEAAIEERKLLVRKCISRIVVDREKSAVRFFIRRIPAAEEWLENVLQKCDGRTTEVVRPSSSGDRNL